MTNLDAIKAKMFPYELPEETLEFLLIEQGLVSNGTYSNTYRIPLMKAVISALYQLITLVREKDNGSEMQYDPDAIMTLIRRYAKDVPGEEESRPQNRDRTEIW